MGFSTGVQEHRSGLSIQQHTSTRVGLGTGVQEHGSGVKHRSAGAQEWVEHTGAQESAGVRLARLLDLMMTPV